MKTLPDSVLAQRMLESRKDGFTFSQFYRRSARRYVLLVAVYAVAAVYLAREPFWPVFWFMMGMFGGCVLRDISWVLSIKRTQPFSRKVTDWDKVQQLAEGRAVE